MEFKKYQCLENDFIIINKEIKNIEQLCDYHKGIGSDGLLVIKNGNILFFNKDGSKANFCGNAVRCAAMHLNKNKIKFMNNYYNISNINNLYTLEFKINDYKKIQKNYLITCGVTHLVIFKKPNINTAIKLFKKHNCNITFYFDNKATTYELGVGFTRGCGSGLICIMNILYKEFNIQEKVIYSGDNCSSLKVKNNKIYLESEVHYVFKGEIEC